MKSDINKAEKKKQLGRPQKSIDEKVLANLSQIGCTQEEIGSIVEYQQEHYKEDLPIY